MTHHDVSMKRILAVHYAKRDINQEITKLEYQITNRRDLIKLYEEKRHTLDTISHTEALQLRRYCTMRAKVVRLLMMDIERLNGVIGRYYKRKKTEPSI